MTSCWISLGCGTALAFCGLGLILRAAITEKNFLWRRIALVSLGIISSAGSMQLIFVKAIHLIK
jgi:hypothetical protein